MLDVMTQVYPMATGIPVLSSRVKPCVCCYLVAFLPSFCKREIRLFLFSLEEKRKL